MSATNSINIDPVGDWQEVVRKQVGSLNFGSIEIVVHDSRIVEIDTTERFRFPNGGLAKSSKPKRLNGSAAIPVNRK